MSKHIGNSLAKVIARWPQDKVDRFKAEMKKMEEAKAVQKNSCKNP